MLKYAHLSEFLASTADGTTARFGVWDRKAKQWRVESQTCLAAEALAVAGQVGQAGVVEGDRLLIAGANPRTTVVLFLAALAAGAAPVISSFRPVLDPPAAQLRRLSDQLDVLGPRARVLGLLPEAIVDSFTHRSITPVLGVETETSVVPKRMSHHHLQFTSGSTGDAKAIVLSSSAVAHNAETIASHLGCRPGAVAVSWLPLYHDMGLMFGAIVPLLSGTDTYLMSTYDYLRDPLDWFRGGSLVGGTHTAGPDFALSEMAQRLESCAESIDMSSWQVIVNGSEPVHANTFRRLMAAGARHGLSPRALTHAYGMAETVLYVAADVEPEPRRVVVPREDLAGLGKVEVLSSGLVETSPPPGDRYVELVACGAQTNVPFTVVDVQNGEPVGDDHIGEIVVSGDSVADCYISGGDVVEALNGTHRTGDLGFVHDGLLYIVDRIKNIVIHGGENHSAAILEAQLASLAHIEPRAVVIFDLDITNQGAGTVAVIEADQGDGDALAEKAWAVRSHLPVPLSAIRVVKRRSLPRTTSGKKQHSLTRRMWHEGTLTVLASRSAVGAAQSGPAAMAEPAGGTAAAAPALHQQVISLVQAATEGHAEVTAASNLVHDLDLDSLSVYELVLQLEEATGGTWDDSAIAGLVTVGDLITMAEHAQSVQIDDASGPKEKLGRLSSRLHGLFLVADEQRGRQILVGDRWLTDFASCNYLAFDLEDEIRASVDPMMRKWGVHPSWTRAVCSPRPYQELEQGLARLIGVDDTVMFPTITLLHAGLLPALAVGGTIFLDSAVHMSVQEAAALAGATRGATVTSFRHENLEDLESKLRSASGKGRRIIAIDGVYSMHGTLASLRDITVLAEKYDAVVYVDDAHGFGLLGRGPTETRPLGHGGGGVVQHLNLSYDRIIYVAGMSKAFSTLGGFVSCTAGVTRELAGGASTAVFGGPLPVPCLAAGLAGLAVNEARGDSIRDRVTHLVRRMTAGFAKIGYHVRNDADFPIVNVVVGDTERVITGSKILWDAGLVITPSVFPAAPIDAGGFRFSPTAANTDDEVDIAIAAMTTLAQHTRHSR